MERSEEDRVAGILRIAVGGTVKAVPTLKKERVREWTLLFDTLTNSQDLQTENGVTALADVTNDAYLQLALAYDQSGALGGREWLEANADPSQLKVAVEQMADNAIPFGDGGAKQVHLGLSALLVRTLTSLVPPKPTSGSSKNGASIRKRSTRVSTPSR